MSVPSTLMAVTYVGNGSSVTAYPVPFPFLETAHILVAKSADGVVAPTLMASGEYVVTRLGDGSGGSVRTVAAVASPATLTIWRQVPLTQPTEIQPAGPFPAKAVETGFDRLLQQIQQLNRKVNQLHNLGDGEYISVPSGGSATRDVLAWPSPAERGAVVATRAGQLGVEISTQTIWISQSTTAGAWSIFRPSQDGKLVIGVIADAGDPGSNQTAAANLLAAWNPDAVIFCGDNNYNGAAGYAADWAAFSAFIDAQKAFPVLGNHDIDNAGWEARHAAKFPYLPGNGRYYSKVLGGGLVEIFFLHSGFNTAGATIEPSGNEVGSAQHAWFIAALAAGRARWRIAVFHHPPASSASGASRVAAQMRWPELAAMDAIFCGHTHTLEMLKWNDTLLVNLSAITRIDGDPQSTPQGGDIDDAILWSDCEKYGIGRAVITDDKLTVEAWGIEAGYPSADGQRRTLLHARDCRDLTPTANELIALKAIDSADTITAATWYLTTLKNAAQVTRISVDTGDTGSGAIGWTVSAGSVVLGGGSLVGGARSQSVCCEVFDSVIPRGAVLSVALTHSGSRKGFNVTLETRRFS